MAQEEREAEAPRVVLGPAPGAPTPGEGQERDDAQEEPRQEQLAAARAREALELRDVVCEGGAHRGAPGLACDLGIEVPPQRGGALLEDATAQGQTGNLDGLELVDGDRALLAHLVLQREQDGQPLAHGVPGAAQGGGGGVHPLEDGRRRALAPGARTRALPELDPLLEVLPLALEPGRATRQRLVPVVERVEAHLPADAQVRQHVAPGVGEELLLGDVGGVVDVVAGLGQLLGDRRDLGVAGRHQTHLAQEARGVLGTTADLRERDDGQRRGARRRLLAEARRGQQEQNDDDRRDSARSSRRPATPRTRSPHRAADRRGRSPPPLRPLATRPPLG
jgi:hypothetical protein